MGNTANFKNGLIIEHKNGLYKIVDFLHVKPGKGAAFVRTKLKNIKTGQVIDETFRSGANVTSVRVEARNYNFLYSDYDNYIFMDNETYEQTDLNRDLLGGGTAYLQEGMEVTLESHEGSVLRVVLPDSAVFEVTETAPALKGQTAAASFKPATLDNGLKTNVPPFVEVGARVEISTEDGSYIKRADD